MKTCKMVALHIDMFFSHINSSIDIHLLFNSFSRSVSLSDSQSDSKSDSCSRGLVVSV